jgi:hypothetical protein
MRDLSGVIEHVVKTGKVFSFGVLSLEDSVSCCRVVAVEKARLYAYSGGRESGRISDLGR